MKVQPTLMESEAAEAYLVAERQLADNAEVARLGERLRRLGPSLVITCARGSSDHAATYAKYLIETRAGTPVSSFAPSTSSLYATPWRHFEGTLFLAISQSGRSPDLLVSAQAARDAGALVVAIVNDPGSPLAEVAELTLPLQAGPERSVAATKSFIASLLVIMRIVAAWTGADDLERAALDVPGALRGAWALDWSSAILPLSAASSLFVVGRGLNLAVAQEAALKLKETCGLHAEAFSAAEVRHGPAALVGPDFPVLMLVPDDQGSESIAELVRDFAARGAMVFATGAEEPDALNLPFLAGLHPVVAPIATIQAFYRFAAALSVARGLDPDQPPHLRKVTETR